MISATAASPSSRPPRFMPIVSSRSTQNYGYINFYSVIAAILLFRMVVGSLALREKSMSSNMSSNRKSINRNWRASFASSIGNYLFFKNFFGAKYLIQW